MGVIQQGVNQALALSALAFSQSPQFKARNESFQSQNALKPLAKSKFTGTSSLGTEKETFEQMQKQAVTDALKAGRTHAANKIASMKNSADVKLDKALQAGGYSEDDLLETNDSFEQPAQKANISSLNRLMQIRTQKTINQRLREILKQQEEVKKNG